jgi:hypothetical protein
MAKPPLLFLSEILQSTKKCLDNLLPKVLVIGEKSALRSLVSDKKTMLGWCSRIRFLRALTAVGFPRPLQFQERIFIGPG